MATRLSQTKYVCQIYMSLSANYIWMMQVKTFAVNYFCSKIHQSSALSSGFFSGSGSKVLQVWKLDIVTYRICRRGQHLIAKYKPWPIGESQYWIFCLSPYIQHCPLQQTLLNILTPQQVQRSQRKCKPSAIEVKYKFCEEEEETTEHILCACDGLDKLSFQLLGGIKP